MICKSMHTTLLATTSVEINSAAPYHDQTIIMQDDLFPFTGMYCMCTGARI